MLEMRKALPADEDAIWEILQPIIERGEEFAYPSASTKQEMLSYWCSPARHTYIAQENGVIVGSFFIQANQPGRGSHIANAAYAVAEQARGKGIGKQMGEYSLVAARQHGFKAMQFNLVVKSNKRAVALWQSIGFSIIGEIPAAFEHQTAGLVNAFILFREL